MYLVIGSKFASPFVIVYEELEAVAFIKAALIRYRVDQDESVCPTDIRFKSHRLGFLERERINYTNWLVLKLYNLINNIDSLINVM